MRLAYVRWLRGRGRLAVETDRELAHALGVTYGWLAKWKIRPDAPDGRTETRAIAQALAPMGVTDTWLFDGEGTPPEPKLWTVWSGQTAVRGPSLEDLPVEDEGEGGERVESSTPRGSAKARRVAGVRRKDR
jgi:transcriptional regulator with XRE-family HTH domain